MWDKERATELIKKGIKSKDELTNEIARYLDYALTTVRYYEDYIERNKK